MELEDGFDDLLAEINEPTSPKVPKIEPEGSGQVQRGEEVYSYKLNVVYFIIYFFVFD